MVNREKAGLSDTELAVLAQEGDASAFEVIYDRHAAGISRALASYAGPDRDVLDDLTQDVFFRVIEGIAAYMPSHPFSHWLYTIALNVGRNYVRCQSKVVFLDPIEVEGVSSGTDGGADWSEAVIGAKLMQLVARLPEAMREVVSLRIGSGMSYGEIAELLGIPDGTARSRMHNALGMLKRQIGLPDAKKKEKG
jgi:RNA polymerase sigma-70 factor (ECF subfamily)